MSIGLISKKDYKINDYISVHVPTLGEIFDFGQREYMGIVSSLVATPYEAMVMLDDMGIDFTAVDEWFVFELMFSYFASKYKKIKIKYFDNKIDKIKKISKGDWIDLRSAETIHLKKGEFHLIPLGVGMKLPEGYEANIVPRSSTYKNFKILQTNCFAVIDNSYSGDSDEWKLPVIAMEDTVINKNDRICQFRINKIQPEIEFEEVEHLDEVSRGGIGSTGKA